MSDFRNEICNLRDIWIGSKPGGRAGKSSGNGPISTPSPNGSSSSTAPWGPRSWRGICDDDFGGAAYHGCNEAIVLSRPDVMEPSTSPTSRPAHGMRVKRTRSPRRGSKLDEYGLGDRSRRVNRRAAEIARAAADRFATPNAAALRRRRRSVRPGCSISSSDPTLSKITFDELAELYREQAEHLVAGGVDLLVIETSQDLLEMKAAIAGIVRAFDRGRAPRSDPGAGDARRHRPHAARHRHPRGVRDARRAADRRHRLELLDRSRAMRDAVRYLVENSRCFVSVIPNAGLPLMGPQGRDDLSRDAATKWRANWAAFVRDFGVNAIGGCCGTTPEHIPAPSSSTARARRASAGRRVAASRGSLPPPR